MGDERDVLDKIDLIRCLDESTCSFCSEKIATGEGIILQLCLHTFCTPCIRYAIEQSVLTQIPCPLNHVDGSGCAGSLLDPEIRSLVPKEIFEEYRNRSLIEAEKITGVFRCKTENCTGMHFVENGEKIFHCPVCNQDNCLKCQVIHAVNSRKHGKKRRRAENDDEHDSPAKKPKEDEFVNAELKKEWESPNSGWHQIRIALNNNNNDLPSTSSGGGEPTINAIYELMASCEIMKSTVEFECSICMTTCPVGEGAILFECYHVFCIDCLGGVVEHCEDAVVKCPYQLNGYSCPCHLLEREIKAIVNPELYERHLRRSITQAEMSMKNSFHCRTANCTSFCEVEEGAENFECDVCKKVNCLKCEAIHEAISCDEYKFRLDAEDCDPKTLKKIEKLLASGAAMRCPTCKIIIQKTQGCDGMVCTCCKTEICWATKGPRWGPKGHRDTSGGCKCRSKELNFKACHPDCHNCH